LASAAAPARPRPPAAAVRPGSAADVPLLPTDNPVLLTIGIMTASLLQILDSTIANVAIPHMQAALGATPDEINWALTSYIIAMAVAMPITGWLADRVGSRRLFLLSVVGFVLSSMLCGLSQNIEQMVMFRALQGATGAFITPLAQAAMVDTNRPSRQGQMMALWGMGIMIGPIAGPLLGGWLTQNWNWRWVFYVNMPLGIAALAILLAGLPSRPLVRRRFDLAGFALIAVALTAAQLMLDRGNHVDWFASLEIWLYAGLAVSAGWIAVIHFATAREPLFSRALFADANFVISMLFMLVVGLVMFANMALLPPMLQHLFGYGVIDTGLALTPRGIGVLISMQVATALMRRGADTRVLVALGFFLAGTSLWQMTGWSLQVDLSHILLTGLIQGLGMGLVFIPLTTAAFATIPPELRTDGSSLVNLSRSVGGSIGISIVTTLLARSLQTSHADLGSHVTGSITQLLDFSTIDRYQALGEAALTMVDAEVNRQAAMIAYVNDFYLMMWLSFAAVPLVLLMKPPQLPPSADSRVEDLPH
jgi:MFS transporter, DHA2 family, multidrug resistance protein